MRQASNAEALVAVAEAALANPDESRPGGERYQIVLHADEAALSHDGEGGCELDDGSALSPETARRLACDASVVRNGRKSRTIPPALRRALRTRDRGCRFPGCENRRFLDAHHVHHWAKGGETTADNLLLLCRRHHRLVHEGGWHVDQSCASTIAGGSRFRRCHGCRAGIPASLSRANGDLDIDAETCEPGTAEDLDLAAAVDALLAISA